MSVLNAQTIRQLRLVSPLEPRTIHALSGSTYGLSSCGYDVRLKQGLRLEPGDFFLGSTVERFDLPTTVMGVLHDKSSLAREGLSVFNTVTEPGWRGYLTLELSNRGPNTLVLEAGRPIAQMVFHFLNGATEQPYTGKYQDQPDRPVPAIHEKVDG